MNVRVAFSLQHNISPKHPRTLPMERRNPYSLSLFLWVIITCSYSPVWSREAGVHSPPNHRQNAEGTDLGELRRQEAKERQQWEEYRRHLESSEESHDDDNSRIKKRDKVESPKPRNPAEHHPLLHQQSSPNYSYFEEARHNFGIGGLDDVWNQIKRRIWIPLLTPPTILQQLGLMSATSGTRPVQGLLLYGPPGCGKTLIAKHLAQLLSPLR